MRIFIGIVFFLAGVYILIAWGAASHSEFDFDISNIDHWILLVFALATILGGIRIVFHPFIKKRKSK
jgi:hypothetical protein